MDTTLESDVLRAGNGDEAAFARLVERTANTVCSIALAIVRNVEASEDIAQEAFLAAWSKQTRRQWMWATISRAMMAALAGAMMMGMAIRGM